mmetsp:Transcript_1627/g.2397  ORF Transcript_1627/g.2397 Transcript_1627/m.2397 type:complete len:325 (+) Transcript_1627:60-1034(+)
MIFTFFLLSLFPHLLEGLHIQPSSPEPYRTIDALSRRSLITSAVAAATTTIVSPAHAVTTVECLTDLPPLLPDKIRLFLCRHGETEYNRLGLVQGARVDVDLNSLGELQAARLGQALSLSAEHPPLFVHSPLKRARQTASIAAAQYTNTNRRPKLKVLTDIAEVDFGSTMDGGKVISNKLSMAATYEAWALGDLDAKMTADGESLRQVLERISRSLYQLQKLTTSRSVVVVSHSSFLKLFLATCQDANILDMRNVLKIGNCCVNVVDIPTAKNNILTEITPASPVLGSPFSKAPSDYSLLLPQSNIVRLNEQRHLIGVKDELIK